MSLDQAPAVKPRQERPRQPAPPVTPPKRQAESPVAQALVRQSQKVSIRAAETARPWYFAAPAVFMGCMKVVFFPIVAAIRAAEFLMAAVVLSIFGAAGGWYLGKITDQQVMDVLQPLGDRLLAMVQSAGLL